MKRTNQFTTPAVHEWLRENLKKRPDLGVVNTLAEWTLESRNPFEAEAFRPPQRWFAFCCLLTVLAVAGFVYFNLFQ